MPCAVTFVPPFKAIAVRRRPPTPTSTSDSFSPDLKKWVRRWREWHQTLQRTGNESVQSLCQTRPTYRETSRFLSDAILGQFFARDARQSIFDTLGKEEYVKDFAKQSNRLAIHRLAKVALVGVPLLAMAAVSMIVPVVSASASTTNSLVVSGALSGTLKIGPVTSCSGSTTSAQLSSFSTTLSSKKYKKWSITISLTKPGAAAKKFNSSTATFVLQSGFNGWVATKGTMTLRNNSGKVNLTLGAHEGTATGTVYVKGSWKCAG